MSDPLLTPEQVAERLGVSPHTVKHWLRTGRLPVVRVGQRGLLRCRESDLEAYIAAHREEGHEDTSEGTT